VVEERQSGVSGTFSFGPFRLISAERRLEQNGAAIHLGARALDILITLVERAGEVVSKQELISHVWPDVVVDEGSLRFHMVAVRRALADGERGARFVLNVPGRGYCFVAPVERSNIRPSPGAVTAATQPSPNLPAPLLRIIGREDNIRTITDQLITDRFVTVVGPGGIGKTTVAVSAAHELTAAFGGAVLFVGLGDVTDPRQVAATLAAKLGLRVDTDDPLPGLVARLRDQRLLLLLDSCDHVIETTSLLAAAIFAEARQVHILATSREALSVEGELVHRLSPLANPPGDAGLTATEALRFPAVELFVNRACASGVAFELQDSDAPVVTEICCKLDGIPLAIEFAAARVAAYGIHEVASLLDGRIKLLWRGKRSALPRHQTLHAALDWSYDLLPELERQLLCRLAVFVGEFTLDAAQVVMAAGICERPQAVETLSSLVAKSLVSTSIRGSQVRYRLLDTTRAYLTEKLIESGQQPDASRHHATYYATLLQRDDSKSAEMPINDWLLPYVEHIDNVRAALNWGFSQQGDVELGTALAAASAPLFLLTSLVHECKIWTERAITALTATTRGTRLEMQLQAVRGTALMFSVRRMDQVCETFQRGLEIADQLGDAYAQIRLLDRLFGVMVRIGDVRGALQQARRAEAVAELLADPTAAAMANSMLTGVHYIMGRLDEADRYADADALGAARPLRVYSTRNGNGSMLAAVHWLRGRLDQSAETARNAIEESLASGIHILACLQMQFCVPILVAIGDEAFAEEAVDKLFVLTDQPHLVHYRSYAFGLRGMLRIKRGDPRTGVPLLRRCVESLPPDHVVTFTAMFLVYLARGLAMTGHFAEALARIDDLITQTQARGDLVYMPELLRTKAEILVSMPQPDLRAADDLLDRSFELACTQTALTWQVRTATTIAGLRRKQGRIADAKEILSATYGRFVEGFESSDLKAAKSLLESLEGVDA
jgi:predicted ATPase/DNA-binding winged helix-turn-helix (wHTH) protein